MKKISVKKEILVVMMLLVMMFALSSQVLATGTSGGPIGINITASPTTPDTNTTTNTANKAETVTPTTNTQQSTYQNTSSLPQTGDASDYAIFMLIAVAIVVAIYAYKKVREYNIK